MSQFQADCQFELFYMLTFKMAAIRLRDWSAFLYQKYYYFSPPVFFLGISSEYETVSSLFMRVLLNGIQDSRYIVVHGWPFLLQFM